MLITFTCDAHETIVMFGDVGLRLLEMMGYNGKMSGVILVDDIPNARLQLRNALNNEINTPTSHLNEDLNEKDSNEPEVSLEHRAFPLFEMLDAAEKEKCDVKWTTT